MSGCYSGWEVSVSLWCVVSGTTLGLWCVPDVDVGVGGAR